jgi:hypothetical protein
LKTKSFTSINNYLSKMVGGLRTPHESRQFSKPMSDVVDLEVKITVRDPLTHKTKEVMFDGVLSDETILMIYKDVEREIKNGNDPRSKSKKGSSKSA